MHNMSNLFYLYYYYYNFNRTVFTIAQKDGIDVLVGLRDFMSLLVVSTIVEHLLARL